MRETAYGKILVECETVTLHSHEIGLSFQFQNYFGPNITSGNITLLCQAESRTPLQAVSETLYSSNVPFMQQTVLVFLMYFTVNYR